MIGCGAANVAGEGSGCVKQPVSVITAATARMKNTKHRFLKTLIFPPFLL
jgi:hypothetical protein